MTPVEVKLLLLGIAMVLTAGAVYGKTRSAWAVGFVVALFMAVAYKLGLIA